MSDEILRLDQVTKQFAKSSVPALDTIDLALTRGCLLSLLGPSGCGKTTLLRLIAGFEQPDQGTISLAGHIVAGAGHSIPPERRRLGMVFQEFALFPHLTVGQNISFGLKQVGLPVQDVRRRTGEALELVALSGLEKRYPHQLSGGQRQRVALARALAPNPDLILLDEPLSNLDVQVRHYLRHEIRHILKETGTTAVFVTHDREEAMVMSDRIGVMRQGQLEQIGTPEEIYCAPRSRFVAEFVSQANFLNARRRGSAWETEVGTFETVTPSIQDGEIGELAIREEDFTLKPDKEGRATILDRQFLGHSHRYCLTTPSGQQIHARTPPSSILPIGSRVRLSASNIRLFQGDRTEQQLSPAI
jgi:iron(III) transport system ATP-binding protein